MTLLVLGALAAPAPADPPETDAAAPAADVDRAAGLVGPPADPWSLPEVAAPRMDAGDEDFVRRPRSPRAALGTPEPGGRTYPWIRTLLALAGVVALILLLAWGYRVGTGAGGRLGLGRARRDAGVIQILSRTNLTPRQSLHLVRIGPRLVLVGATADALRALAVIDDAELAARLAGQTAQQDPDSHVAAFRQCLSDEARSYLDGAEAPAPEEPGPARVRALAESLAQTARRLRSAAASPGRIGPA